jgi:predicted NAD-dependent protein-ADP-ribosyltransferase YbiA (DUF1768 family)
MVYKKSYNLVTNASYYDAAVEASKLPGVLDENGEFSQKDLLDAIKDPNNPKYTNLAVATFLHFLEIEKQIKGLEAVKKENPDTRLLKTVQQVRKKEQMFLDSTESSKVDPQLPLDIRNKSILSSFYINDMTLDLIEPVLPLRLNKISSDFITKVMNTHSSTIANKYGVGMEGEEKFTSDFNNAVINYIFQNFMSNFVDSSGNIVEVPDIYRKRNVIIKPNIKNGVEVVDGKVYVDVKTLRDQYKNQKYLRSSEASDSYSKIGLLGFSTEDNPFPTQAIYNKYVFEREYLRTIYPQQTEKYLNQRALLNTFNRDAIVGTNEYSYTDLLMRTVKEFSYMSDKYPILEQLSRLPFKGTEKIVQLNNQKLVKGDLAEVYYENLKDLANEDNTKIKEAFKLFSLMMIHQHGVGYSKYGFVKALDDTDYIRVMDAASKVFLDKNLNEGSLRTVFKKLMSEDQFKNYVVSPREFNTGTAVLPVNEKALELGTKVKEYVMTQGEEKFDQMMEQLAPELTIIDVPENLDLDKLVNEEYEEYVPVTYKSLSTMINRLYRAGANIDQLPFLFNDFATDEAMDATKFTIFLDNNLETLKDDILQEVKQEIPVSQDNKPKGKQVKEGIYVNQGALTKEEQLELFDYLKPFLEEQADKSLKATQGSKMIGLGLRWDYTNNNPGRPAVNIPDPIIRNSRYGYYNQSVNGQPLGQITPRFRELMQKATGVDMTNYDGAIINLYEKDTFISSHNDVDESKSALKYPVIGINIGGKGNFSIEPRDGSPIQILDLSAGTGYIFGVDGINREVYHRTFPTPQDSFLPQLTTKIDGKTYPAGSYRITITMRRVMPLTEAMPEAPSIVSESAPTQAPVLISPTDKIIWGHPTIGKTTAKQEKDFFDFDTDFKPLVAQKLGLPKSEQNSIGLNKWRKTGSEEEFNKAMREVWSLAKAQAKQQNKMLMVSDMLFLRENASDFDKIVNIPSKTFIERATERGDNKENLQNWKTKIDKVLEGVDQNKIITTDKFLSELLPTTAPVTTDSKKIVEDLFTNAGGKKVSKGMLQVDGQHWYIDNSYWKIEYKKERDELFFYPNDDTEIYIGDRPAGTKNFTIDEDIDTRSFTELAAAQPTQTAGLPGSEKKINIFAGTGENAELSNFAERPVTLGGQTFRTPEGAFQAMKIWFTNAVLLGTPASKENLEILEKLKNATGKQAKSLGRQIKDLSNATWDRDSSGVMKNILTLSFEQNPVALAKLRATGNATLTHTQDTGKWGKEFPRLLMEVREELKSAEPTTADETVFEGPAKLSKSEQINILETELAGLLADQAEARLNSIPIIIAEHMNKITPESARRETGVKIGTGKDINPNLLSNTGFTVEKAAEYLQMDFFNGETYPEVDEQEIRNYIIEILQEGKNNFIESYLPFQDRISEIRYELNSIKSKPVETGQLNLFDFPAENTITDFYSTLTEAQREKLGNLANVIDTYNEMYSDTMSVQEYIDNVLNCKI